MTWIGKNDDIAGTGIGSYRMQWTDKTGDDAEIEDPVSTAVPSELYVDIDSTPPRCAATPPRPLTLLDMGVRRLATITSAGRGQSTIVHIDDDSDGS